MLIVFSVGGIFGNSFGVFLPVVSSEMGWSRGAMALALSLGITAFGLRSEGSFERGPRPSACRAPSSAS